MKKAELRLVLFLSIFLTPILFPSCLSGWGRKPPPEPKTIEEKIARKFHIEHGIVLALQEKGYGTEEIIKILILATATGKGADEISILREEGMDWEAIAKWYGVEMSTLGKETQRFLSEVGGVKEEEEEIKEEEEPEIELEIEKELRKKLEMEKTESDELR
jgi:hypothetical protein